MQGYDGCANPLILEGPIFGDGCVGYLALCDQESAVCYVADCANGFSGVVYCY
jgi:hypothetical protein